MVKVITTPEELKQIASTADGKLIVIDFFAQWCGPCKMIAPKYAQFSEQNPDVIFLKVDVDEAGALAEEFGINAMPTFVFMKKAGGVVDTLEGANAAELEKKIQQHK